MTLGKALQTIRPAGTIVLAGGILMAAALYNGYPLVWFDSDMYVRYTRTTIRPPFYSLLLYPMHLGRSLWPVPFWQSVIIAHLLRLTIRHTFGPISSRRFLSLIAVLAVFSTLPWVTGYVMADIFTPVLILSLYLLTFCAQTLHPAERVYLAAITVVAILVHASNVPLAFALLALFGATALVLRVSGPSPLRSFARLTAPLAIALSLLLANNLLAHHRFAVSPSGYAFLLARLVADGPGIAFLNEQCHVRQYALCDFLDAIPRNSDRFLWDPHSPFVEKLGWFDGYRTEGTEIVVETVKEFPLWVGKAAVVNVGRQLAMFNMSDTYQSMDHAPLVQQAVQTSFPGDYRDFENAKQYQGRLPLTPLAWTHMIALLVGSTLSAIACVRSWRNRDRRPVLLFVAIVAGILLSAGLASVLSTPHPRYVNRTVWLVLFFGVAAVAPRRSVAP